MAAPPNLPASGMTLVAKTNLEFDVGTPGTDPKAKIEFLSPSTPFNMKDMGEIDLDASTVGRVIYEAPYDPGAKGILLKVLVGEIEAWINNDTTSSPSGDNIAPLPLSSAGGWLFFLNTAGGISKVVVSCANAARVKFMAWE